MSERMMPISEEYARLSLLVGRTAGAADRHLGRDYFGPMVRARAWELTPEFLDVIRKEAIMLGVPADALPREDAT